MWEGVRRECSKILLIHLSLLNVLIKQKPLMHHTHIYDNLRFYENLPPKGPQKLQGFANFRRYLKRFKNALRAESKDVSHLCVRPCHNFLKILSAGGGEVKEKNVENFTDSLKPS